jgi:hypothetical protein
MQPHPEYPSVAIPGRHLSDEPQRTVGIDLGPQDRIEALKGSSQVRAVSQNLAGVFAQEPSSRRFKVESECGECGLAFFAVEPILVACVGVVPKEHPDVGGILARRGGPPVRPSPDLEKGKGRQRGDVDGNTAGQLHRDGRCQSLGETRDAHDLSALRGPSDVSVRTLDATEGNDVQALIAKPKAMRTIDREASRCDEGVA